MKFIRSIIEIVMDKQKIRATELEGSNSNDIEDTFQEVITSKRKRKLNKDANSSGTKKKSIIDLEHYVPYRPSDDTTEKG